MKLVASLAMLFFLITVSVANAQLQVMPTDGGALIVELSTIPETLVPGPAEFVINFLNPTTQQTQIHIDYSMIVEKGNLVYGEVENTHTGEGRVKIPIQVNDEGQYTVTITASGIFFQPITPQSVTFNVNVSYNDPPPQPAINPDNGGGCLIATATYGTELAPKIQHLRELRDNVIMNTESGRAFLLWFNDAYYTFSPTVADFERQSPIFKNLVRLVISPMVATFSLLDRVTIDNELDMIGYGIGTIMLNLAIYAGLPFVTIFGVYKFVHIKSL